MPNAFSGKIRLPDTVDHAIMCTWGAYPCRERRRTSESGSAGYSLSDAGVVPDGDLAQRVNQETRARADELMNEEQGNWAEQEWYSYNLDLAEEWDARCNATVERYMEENADFTTVDETTAGRAGFQPEYSIAAGTAGIMEIPVA